MKKVFIFLFLLSFGASAQDTLVIDKWLNEARNLLDSDIAQAEAVAKKALAASLKANYPKGIGRAYMRLGVVMGKEGKTDSGLYYFKSALSIRKRLNDQQGSAGALREISYAFRARSEIDSAFEYCFQALRINEAIGNKSETGMNYQDIGALFLDYGNGQEARQYFDKAVIILTEANDSGYLGAAYNKLGNFYFSTHNYDSAIVNYFKALSIYEAIGDAIPAAQNISNIAACYFFEKKYTPSISFYHRALAFYTENEIEAEIPGIYNSLGSVYEETGNVDSALYYLNKSIATAIATGNMSMQVESYEALSKLYEHQGNFEASLNAYKKYFSTTNSLLNDEKVKQISEMQTKYQTEKKENQIIKLNRENELKESENRQQRIKIILSFIALGIGALFFAIVFYQKNKISKEKQRSDELLLNILPAETAEELKLKGESEARLIDEVTVLFTDFKGFTQVTEQLGPKELVAEIHECFSAFDRIMQEHGLEKIKTIGDAYMAAGGIPVANKTHAPDTVRAAMAILKFMNERNKKASVEGKLSFEVRIGIHTGPVVAGIVGIKKFAYDIWGDTVNTASRMESSGEAGKINISGDTYALVKDKFTCTYRGKILAKNKGEIDMYFVET
ncbi:MAG: adenylate/guanylate cyclase domain-containing protein [Ferruginibacter sp.]